MNIKLTKINPDDLILAIKAAKSFASEDKPIGIRHGTFYTYDDRNLVGKIMKVTCFYVYRTKTMIVVRDNNG